MKFMNLFSNGATSATLGVSAIFLIIIGASIYFAVKKSKENGGTWYTQKNMIHAAGALLLWIVCLIMINSDYRDVDQSKYKPTPQNDGRIPAQDMIPKNNNQ